jgi:hypothetical protein
VSITGDLPNNLGVSVIFVDWQYSIPALWVGTSRGVFHSVNLGQNWTKFGIDMPNTNLTDLEGLSSANVLAAATGGRGAFEIFIKPSSISGAVFQSPGNKPMPGAYVFLDVNGNGIRDASECQTPTDVNGQFQFATVPPGMYTPRVVAPAGYVQTNASTKTIAVNGSDVQGHSIVIQPELQLVPFTLHPSGFDLLPGQREDHPTSAPDEFDRQNR